MTTHRSVRSRCRARRAEARQIVGRDPLLARELMIGRSDLYGGYDDGGLVDWNSAPAAVVARTCGMDVALAQRICRRPSSRVPFARVEDAITYTDIPVELCDRIRDRAVPLTA